MESTSADGGGFLSRMALNDNKAGMEGLDRERINKIIIESSKGSRFYENEAKKELQVNQRIEKMTLQRAQITEQQLQKAHTQVEKMVNELDMSRDLSRLIVHVDMDAFYAAVEMRDCPELKDKPMAVGSMSMLSTSNYHARKFGVRAAMPGFIAKKLCPNLVIVPCNFDKYRAVSNEIRKIFAAYDPNFMPMSLDEAYLDFTDHLEQRISWPESLRTHCLHTDITETGELQSKVPQESEPCVENLSPLLFEDSPSSTPSLPPSGEKVESGGGSEVFGTCVEEAVREMRFRIEQKTTLTASAGIAPNTMIAKVCSDKNKPNGQYRVPSNREAVMDFIQTLPVRKVSGIGKVSEKMLSSLGITTCAHLGQQMALLSLMFSETAWHHFMRISLGLGSTHMERDGERKSMSTERTFREMSVAEEQLSLCRELCEDLAADMKKEGLRGKTITLKLKNVKFEVKSRACTLPCAVATTDEIFAAAKDLLKTEIENVSPQQLQLRLMGVRISTFVSADDKKPQQKSIVGFLQQGSSGPSHGIVPNSVKETASHLPMERPPPAGSHILEQLPQKVPKLQGLPWAAWQTGAQVSVAGENQPQSFFQKAYTKKLSLQVRSLSETDKGQGSVCSGFTQPATDNPKSRGAVIEMHESAQGLLGSSGNPSITREEPVRVAPPEASASTSGAAAPDPETLTCPVCFGEVRTTDLQVFNRHIDLCLSGVATETPTDTDSESDGDGGPKGFTVIDEGVPEKGEDKERQKRSNPEDALSAFKTCDALRGPSVTRAEDTGDPGAKERRSGDKPLLDHHGSRRVHSPQRASSSHRGDPATQSSRLEAPPGHEGSTLICPVCQVPQNTHDLTVFNHHVDLCLNQEVLHMLAPPSSSSSSTMRPPVTAKRGQGESELHTARPNKGKSKRRGPPASPPAKKAKGRGSQNTIDKFFM
ncbi:DNA polymerase kappa isoform X1 [Gadus morhua]|uniref:DNA polymerase kappa isoform X1 n=1 Tax=Gadus morhua TaxID=8049 RepID=UPI0011B5C761|nr:DNA polymerase kappa isoform X1 [Gadus morhua]